MAADSYLYKEKPIFFRLVLSLKRYYAFCPKKRLQFLTKLCQQHYGDLKKITSAPDHRQKGSTRGHFYCLQNNTILLPTKEHNSTAYRRAQFYCIQKSTILLPTEEHSSTAYRTAQFYCLQKSTVLLPTEEHNSTAYRRAQFYCLQKSTVLLPTEEHSSTAYRGAQFYCLQRSTILLPTEEHNTTAYRSIKCEANYSFQRFCIWRQFSLISKASRQPVRPNPAPYSMCTVVLSQGDGGVWERP